MSSSSIIQTAPGALIKPYQANITVPNWMLSSMERVMQYYVDKNLRLDTQSASMMPAPVEGHRRGQSHSRGAGFGH